jgi:hypothetical protein
MMEIRIVNQFRPEDRKQPGYGEAVALVKERALELTELRFGANVEHSLTMPEAVCIVASGGGKDEAYTALKAKDDKVQADYLAAMEAEKLPRPSIEEICAGLPKKLKRKDRDRELRAELRKAMKGKTDGK